MSDRTVPDPKLLAELLRIQRWAGGEHVSASRIYGLMHGFETVIRQENESFGVSEETQRKVEDILDDVDCEKQSIDGMAIKDRLRHDGVNETDVARVMELCRLQSRFGPAIDKIVQGSGSVFSDLDRTRLPEQDWYGSLHYMELIDCTDGAHKNMHAVSAPAVPRIGELVKPQKGSMMQVVGVEHVIINQGRGEGLSHHCIVPYVLLEAVNEDES